MKLSEELIKEKSDEELIEILIDSQMRCLIQSELPIKINIILI
jgi:hypothetical protein